MKNKTHFFTFFTSLILSVGLFSQDIPYNLYPEWESTPAGHYATGLGLADIDGDGWKDIIVANGNDMQIQHLVVYYNNGDGSFPLMPDWQSDDIDYHGQLAVGDINGDEWPDVAVSVYIGHNGFSEPGRVKVYYNTGGELESNPSFESVDFYTFSCALGDADGDGDLDLAVVSSEPYNQIFDSGKIFFNQNGLFNQNPDWESTNEMGAMDVEFADMDNNGFLDLVFTGEYKPSAIFLADDNGNISPSPAWQSSEPDTYYNSLDIGFFGDNTYSGFVTTGNNQLGGDGKVHFYDFPEGIPTNSYPAWRSPYLGYGSGVILADVNKDVYLDLIYGGWWKPMKIILGTGTGFEDLESYTSNTSSVVETIQMADLGREAVVPLFDTLTEIVNLTSAIRLRNQIIENILNVYRNGQLLEKSDYCYVPNKNWISFKTLLSAWDVIIVEYEHSADNDIVISNWDSGKGNYIFYNTNISTGQENFTALFSENLMKISPNPASTKISVSFSINSEKPVEIKITDLKGRLMKSFSEIILKKSKRYEFSVEDLPGGIYFVIAQTQTAPLVGKLIIQTKK